MHCRSPCTPAMAAGVRCHRFLPSATRGNIEDANHCHPTSYDSRGYASCPVVVGHSLIPSSDFSSLSCHAIYNASPSWFLPSLLYRSHLPINSHRSYNKLNLETKNSCFIRHGIVLEDSDTLHFPRLIAMATHACRSGAHVLLL